MTHSQSSLRLALAVILLMGNAVIQAQPLTEDSIKGEIGNMMGSGNYDGSILAISKPVNDIQVVHTNLPYRDFPNILIFKLNTSKHRVRVLEGLNPGIQDSPSGHLDWHTKGRGVDFIIGSADQPILFDDEKFRKMQDAIISRRSILIPYQHFLHMQTIDSLTSYSPYTIDKTHYYDFALQLFGDLYTGYSKEECTMFDSPKIEKVDLSYKDGRYIIKAVTEKRPAMGIFI